MGAVERMIGRTLNQKEVFELVKAERQRQDEKWGKLEDRPQSVAGFIIVAELELAEAKAGWSKNVPGKHSALTELVQVAATAVAAVEKFGGEGNCN